MKDIFFFHSILQRLIFKGLLCTLIMGGYLLTAQALPPAGRPEPPPLTKLNEGQKNHIELYLKLAKLRLARTITRSTASKFLNEPIVDNLPEMLLAYQMRLRKIPYQITQEVQDQNRADRILLLNQRRLIYEKFIVLIPQLQKAFEEKKYAYFNQLLGQYSSLERELFFIRTKPIERPWLLLSELMPAIKLLTHQPQNNY